MKNFTRELTDYRQRFDTQKPDDRLDTLTKLRHALIMVRGSADVWLTLLTSLSEANQFHDKHLKAIYALTKISCLNTFDMALYFESIKKEVGLDDTVVQPDGAGVT